MNCTLGYSSCWRSWLFTRTGGLSSEPAAVIALHHLLFNFLQAAHYQVWVFTTPSLIMVFVHAAYVVVETFAICYLAAVLSKMTGETASQPS